MLIIFIRPRVTLHGWLAQPRPLDEAAGATVLCSEYEGLSNAVLESMAIGIAGRHQLLQSGRSAHGG